MFFLNPMELDQNVTLHASHVTDAISAIGTDGYDAACLGVFAHALGAEHWAFFHHKPGRIVRIAAASRNSVPSGESSVQRFMSDCHRFDPALTTAAKHSREPILINRMEISDIPDPRYRRCFELTGVTERLSLYSRYASELYQLSIYRTVPHRTSVSAPEVKHFTSLASLIMTTGLKHEMLRASEIMAPTEMGLADIEARLQALPGQLSERECQVCARAALGRTIERTALELDIKPSSVMTYRQRAYQKLGVKNQNELVALLNRFRM
jgi:DNA-binding CsgD family transcriptional regulator